MLADVDARLLRSKRSPFSTSTPTNTKHFFVQTQIFSLNKARVLPQVLFFGLALRCATLRVEGITTRSVVQLSFPTQAFLTGLLTSVLPHGVSSYSKAVGGIRLANQDWQLQLTGVLLVSKDAMSRFHKIRFNRFEDVGDEFLWIAIDEGKPTTLNMNHHAMPWRESMEKIIQLQLYQRRLARLKRLWIR